MPPIHTGKNINELPINRSHNVGTASIMVTMQSVIKLRTQTNKSVSRIPKEQAHIISPVNSRLEILLKFSSLAKITAIRLIIFIWRLSRRIRNIRKIKEFRLLIWPQRRRIMTDIFSGIRKKESLHRRKSVKIIGRCLYSEND